jgi:PleD family two-component response regulator
METTKIDKKVLVVEDDSFILDTIVRKFNSSGFSVSFAKNADEAKTSIKEKSPDIVLLDIIFPQGNGLDFLAELKKDDITKDIPVVIFSNLSSEREVNKAKELGAVDFIVKATISPGQVVMKVKEILKIE